MNVTVIGCGYVGLCSGTCLASIGHTVRGVEKMPAKLAKLQAGDCPIFEPGLAERMTENIREGRLSFTGDVAEAVEDAQIVFLAVGTPPKPDGTVDMTFLETAGREVCEALEKRQSENAGDMVTIIVKSTVPAGTNRKLSEYLKEHTNANVRVVSNPEFLKEGTAVDDFLRPDRVVIGCESGEPEAPEAQAVHQLYDPILREQVKAGNPNCWFVMNWESAELTKYAANTMLAARISFMNELTILCEHYGADIEAIRRGMGSDKRIGPAFLRAGCGYGGSCFPKDVAAMEHISRQANYENKFVHAIIDTNNNQKKRFAQKITDKLGRDAKGATVAVWGLAFKADTDDIRESTAIDVIKHLVDNGVTVKAYDPKGVDNMKEIFTQGVEWCVDPVRAAEGADAIAICTDWLIFETMDFSKVKAVMNKPLIFDGRNCLHRTDMKRHGIEYYPMGRPDVQPGGKPSSVKTATGAAPSEAEAA
ncbi:MAG: UDP-glucose/GDP-mannose dehydrogenase family protein [Planctomycetota bacterium]